MSGKIGRREFLTSAAMLPMLRSIGMTKGDRLRLYVGTYTSGGSKSKGVYLLDFDASFGTLSAPKLVANTDEPSFLTISQDGKFLYSVNENIEYEGKLSGSVSSFAVDRESGSLTFLNRQPSHGGAPCHISISDDGGFVLVANYMGGNAVAYPVGPDGSLSPSADIKQHSGNGPNKDRQKGPHAHSIILDPANKFAFVPDLGIDKIIGYSLDKRGKLAVASSFIARPGAGPRHFKFHPNGKFGFVNNELDMTVTALAYNAGSGSLKEIHTLSSLPEGYKISKLDSGADLHVSRDGRFLYTSNRGHDSIATFSIEQTSGKLTFVEAIKAGGETPRNFAIDPTGKYLLVANQNSDSIAVFSIEPQTGKLTPTDKSAKVSRPACLVFGK